jgi:hypothetical protein
MKMDEYRLRCKVVGEWLAGKELVNRVNELEALNARLVEALEEYGVHMAHCLLSQWRAGRPTKDGGYESKYGDKWYQGDDKPKCTCGLDAALQSPEPPKAGA